MKRLITAVIIATCLALCAAVRPQAATVEMCIRDRAYAKGGGISKKEWRSMQDQIAKEDARREGHHK